MRYPELRRERTLPSLQEAHLMTGGARTPLHHMTLPDDETRFDLDA